MTGECMHRLAAELYPICRSITGNGIRQTLAVLGREIPLAVTEIPSGTQVFDWTVPREWNIRDAWIRNSRGQKVADFRESNLHVVNYSAPVHATVSLEELARHVHSLPEHPDWIPYRTSYYREAWGFCLRHTTLASLPEDEYEVMVDSSLENGSLTYAECYLPGSSPEEVLISSHICHPSLANDNLSGITVAAFLAKRLAERPRRYSYRFVFAPGTIGAIAWLAMNRQTAGNVKHGLVLTCVGDAGGFTYKKSRRGDAEIDRAMALALKEAGEGHTIQEFSPYGYDERQYCSPGFNLPVGCLMRTPWGKFPQYHTSADNLDFIRPEQLEGSLRLCDNVVEILEGNKTYRNLSPFCEPQLGKRGLYGAESENMAALWILNLADGGHSLVDMAERSGMPSAELRDAAERLNAAGLIDAQSLAP